MNLLSSKTQNLGNLETVLYCVHLLFIDCSSHFEGPNCVISPALLSTADPSSESKEDQWMGVTVQSQGPGGKVVVSVEKRVHSTMSECLLRASMRRTVVNKTGRAPAHTELYLLED